MADFDLQRALWHGADYNPEQWQHVPGIWDADLRLMKLAGMSSATIGIFSWAELEPHEGEYHFDWMDEVFDNLSRNGQHIVLATPSGAKPHWMARQYPEIRRVVPERGREAQKGRHNHCPTSPIYRAKVAQMNRELSRRYGPHPSLLAWHLSNEYSGECGCDLCFGAFRRWLRDRYGDDLDELNRRFWSRFWSHTYADWDEIDFIDNGVHGLVLDWKRFMTYQTVDFMKGELAALREHSDRPATTNLMGDFTGLDYAAFAPHLDFVSWDAYPNWGSGTDGDEREAGCWAGFHHDLFRSLKGRPFWLMESSPSQTNWRDISRLKAPGIHRLSGWQAVAHGADGVMYFQWRQSRGSSEKFHGAVVSHEGSEKTRTFQEVAVLGEELGALGEVAGSRSEAEIGLIYDFENLWGIEGEFGPRNVGKDPAKTALDFYRPCWEHSYPTDVITSTAEFDSYKLLIAPMLYMLRPGVAERLSVWVQNGGTLVTTYWSGMVDENDLCFSGGFPGPLRSVLGLWVEETDVLQDHQRNIITVKSPELGWRGQYEARDYCDLVHLEGARALGHYGKEFYAGRPAVTMNSWGEGHAYYVASRNESGFQDALIGALLRQSDIARALDADLSPGVVAQRRIGDNTQWVWVTNFTAAPQAWTLHESGFERFNGGTWQGMRTGRMQELPPYDVAILRKRG